jgi:hypothetical protein
MTEMYRKLEQKKKTFEIKQKYKKAIRKSLKKYKYFLSKQKEKTALLREIKPGDNLRVLFDKLLSQERFYYKLLKSQ